MFSLYEHVLVPNLVKSGGCGNRLWLQLRGLGGRNRGRAGGTTVRGGPAAKGDVNGKHGAAIAATGFGKEKVGVVGWQTRK